MSELADDLGVSVRTIGRDVERMRLSGVPLQASRGRGGGVRLPRTKSSLTVTLDISESAALVSSLTALGPTASESAASAMRKLVMAMQPAPGEENA